MFLRTMDFLGSKVQFQASSCHLATILPCIMGSCPHVINSLFRLFFTNVRIFPITAPVAVPYAWEAFKKWKEQVKLNTRTTKYDQMKIQILKLAQVIKILGICHAGIQNQPRTFPADYITLEVKHWACVEKALTPGYLIMVASASVRKRSASPAAPWKQQPLQEHWPSLSQEKAAPQDLARAKLIPLILTQLSLQQQVLSGRAVPSFHW